MFLEDISGGKQVIRAASLCFTDAGQQFAESIPGLKVYRFGRDFSDSRHLVEKLFTGHRSMSAVIFFSSVGIAVRLIAPYIADKKTDPAVIAVNDTAQFVIPVLSGHTGRANELSVWLANQFNAQPVITTASDHREGIHAPDLWAVREGYSIQNPKDVNKVTAAIVAGGKPEIIHRKEDVVWRVLIDREELNPEKREVSAVMTPRKYVVGIGCRKGIESETLKHFAENQLDRAGIRTEQVFKICSIDLKAEEAAVQDLARQWNRPFVVFSAEQMNQLSGVFSASSFVEKITGTNNVCERSALAGCSPWEGHILVHKCVGDGMTLAVAERQLGVCYQL